MNTESITYTIEIVYYLRGFDGLGFGKDKRLYNLKTSRPKKKSYCGGSIGYWIDKKFITLTAMRKLLYKQQSVKTPF